MANKPATPTQPPPASSDEEAILAAKKLAAKKAKEKKEQEKKAQEKPKQKQWFIVRIEGVAPVVVEFKVFAEDGDAAFDAVERRPNPFVYAAIAPQIDLRRLQKKRVSIKNLLTGWINWIRNF